ncbi:MAG: hypothetical protein R2707_16500 [Acidimicrobiales bacterium]
MNLAILVGCVVAGLAVLIIRPTVFPDGSVNLDEIAYLTQASAIESGDLTLPASTHDPHFRPFLSATSGDRIIFKYQPLWPSVIAAGNALGFHGANLLALLAAAGPALLAWFTFEVGRDRIATIASASIASLTPFLWIQSSTFLGYHPSVLLVCTAGALLLRGGRTASPALLTFGATVASLGLLHRPFDTAILIIPVALYVVWQSRLGFMKIATCFAIGSVGPLVLFLLYNAHTTGRATQLPFNISGGLDKFGFGTRASFVVPESGPDGQVNYTPGKALQSQLTNLRSLPRFLAAAPLIVGLAVAASVGLRKRPEVRLLLAMSVTIVVGYTFWWGTANLVEFELHRSLGPAYHYSLLIPVVTLASIGFSFCWNRWNRPILVSICIVLSLAWIPMNVAALQDAQQDGDLRSAQLAIVDEVSEGLVIAPPLYPGDPYVRVANDAQLQNPVIVALDTGDSILDLVRMHPDREVAVVRQLSAFDDLFGPSTQSLVRPEVLRSDGNGYVVTIKPMDERFSVAYLGIDDTYSSLGDLADTGGAMRVSESDLKDAQTLTVGVQPIDEDGDQVQRWAECVFEVGVSETGNVELLAPCAPQHFYVFPNSEPFVAREDISSIVRVRISEG